MRRYNWYERQLHRLAFGSPGLSELIFDLEKSVYGEKAQALACDNHVFVSGLARAGTTVLMRALYETREFASLTYRDMPFVLAPNLWRRVTSRSHKSIDLAPRAHADGILVGADSPEALDEVFWNQIGERQDVTSQFLPSENPSVAQVSEFTKYCSLICLAKSKSRYLSKNNNYVMRLKPLAQAMPGATFLVPFREPVRQASSLLQQHKHFSKMQKDDPFVLEYMNWLGHHEFGNGHKRFQLGGYQYTFNDPDLLEYWVEIWLAFYSYVLSELLNEHNVVATCYEALCDSPEYFGKIAKRLGVEQKVDYAFKAPIASASAPHSSYPFNEAKRVYERLIAHSFC